MSSFGQRQGWKAGSRNVPLYVRSPSRPRRHIADPEWQKNSSGALPRCLCRPTLLSCTIAPSSSILGCHELVLEQLCGLEILFTSEIAINIVQSQVVELPVFEEKSFVLHKVDDPDQPQGGTWRAHWPER